MSRHRDAEHNAVFQSMFILENLPMPDLALYEVEIGLLMDAPDGRSEEHTSELQSRTNLVCRLLLEKKKNEKNKTCSDYLISSSQIKHDDL